MSVDRKAEVDKLATGKVIIRRFTSSGLIEEEIHTYGVLAIGHHSRYENGIKASESYFVNKRLVSRKTYEARRIDYSDMPLADTTVEDLSGGMMRDVRYEQRVRKREAEQRLKHSGESQFERPKGTNWLRVIAKEKAHLVEFQSRDWKALSKEIEFKTGRAWLDAFGFCGRPSSEPLIHHGVEIGYEVSGDREIMLNVTKRLLIEVIEFAKKPPEPTPWHDSFAPRRRKYKRKPPLAWPNVLPPLIDFLSGLTEATVKIFNHHQ